MKKKLSKLLVRPEFSLFLLCCVPAACILPGRRAVALTLAGCITAAVILLACKRLLKKSRTNRKSRLFMVLEIIGCALLGAAYGIVYDKITPENVVNLVFVLGSLVFLIPFIAEIGTERANKS